MEDEREGAPAPFPPRGSTPCPRRPSAEWMTRGRPVSRAAAMWRRKPVACAGVVAVVVVVEPGLADGDAARMLRSAGRGRPSRCRALHARCADACRPSTRLRGCASAIAVISSKRFTRVEIVTMPIDAGRRGARQDAGAVRRQLGEIEMAVAVDQHGHTHGGLPPPRHSRAGGNPVPCHRHKCRWPCDSRLRGNDAVGWGMTSTVSRPWPARTS